MVGIRDLHRFAIGDRRRELQVQAVFDPEVVLLERRGKNAALEPDGLN